MDINENQIKEKHGKQCKHCFRNTLLPYEVDYTCFSCCGNNVIKQKNSITKIQR